MMSCFFVLDVNASSDDTVSEKTLFDMLNEHASLTDSEYQAESSAKNIDDGVFSSYEVNETFANIPVFSEKSFVLDDMTGGITEMVELREENIKHFKMLDGTYKALVYGTSVHRMDSKGNWDDIDNSLELFQTSAGEKYATRDRRVVFSKSFTLGDELVTINENNYQIAMSLISNNNEMDSTKISTQNNMALKTVTEVKGEKQKD